ncbi:MAG: glycosyltransferase family 2 protein [Candidatus Krumholzibacteriota bacterium]
MPHVSIGMPVYNGEEFIVEAIESLLAQSFTDFELLIADNASTDRTPEICREFLAKDSRVRWLPSPVNRGAAWNFNRLFFEAKGEFFRWSAADDVTAPDFLEKCVAVFDENPGVVLCHCHTSKIDAQGNRLGQYDLDNGLDVTNPARHRRFRAQILPRHSCVHVFGLIRREILAKTPLIGPYVSSDRVLLAELALYGPHHVIPEYMFARRHHEMTSIHLDERTERAEWFDTKKKGKIALPAWRVVGELGMAVLRAPLNLKEFVQCGVEILRHCKYRRTALGQDLKQAWNHYSGQGKAG